jgi:hypothetical protein
MQGGVKSMTVAEIFQLCHAAGSHISLLRHAAGSKIFPLHFAAGRMTPCYILQWGVRSDRFFLMTLLIFLCLTNTHVLWMMGLKALSFAKPGISSRLTLTSSTNS